MGAGESKTIATLSLGGNLGDVRATLQSAVETLGSLGGVVVTAVSSVYETDPWGPIAQPDFLNVVVIVEVAASIDTQGFLDALLSIEDAHGRVREVRWGPRTLDIDIVAFGEIVSDDPRLMLPHPRAAERAFVLVPWMELAPEADLPGYGRVSDLARDLDCTAVRLRSDLKLHI